MADPLGSPRVGIYRWHNLQTREYEQPIALCDIHRARLCPRTGFALEPIVGSAAVACQACVSLAAAYSA
jgi:hypothetical protein